MYKLYQKGKPNALIPTQAELIFLPLVSLFLLLFFSFDKITRDLGLTIDLVSMPESFISAHEIINTKILPNVATAVVWAAIGLVLYLVAWVIVDSVSQANKANSLTHRFIYPSREKIHSFRFTLFGQLYIRALASILLIFWSFFLINVISTMAEYFYDSGWSLGIVLSVFYLSLYLFLSAPITRLIVLRPRVWTDIE